MAKTTKKENLETGIVFKETETHKFVIMGKDNYFELHKKDANSDVRIFINGNTNIAQFKKDCKKYC